MFLRARDSLPTFLQSYHVRVTSTRKSGSTFGTKGTRRYWWLCLIDFWNFFTIYVFEVKESICDIPTGLPCLCDDVISKIKVNFRFTRYWWLCHIDFWNFFTVYFFEVEESTADIPARLSYLGDLKNPGQLPVQEVLRGTDDCVFWIFVISWLSSINMFSRSGNHLLTGLLSYNAPLDNPEQLPVMKVFEVTHRK